MVKRVKGFLVFPIKNRRVIHGRVGIFIEVLVVSWAAYVRHIRRRLRSLVDGIPVYFSKIFMSLDVLRSAS